MNKIIILLLMLSSCSPERHIVGSGMRNYNLSKNKYKPNKNEYNSKKSDQRN